MCVVSQLNNTAACFFFTTRCLQHKMVPGFALRIAVSFWMLLFGVYFSSKTYQLITSRFPASILAECRHDLADFIRPGCRG